MSKTIYNNNNILKSTSINYDSFVRIAKILRPSTISFRIKQYFFDNSVQNESFINYGEDLYTIYYRGKNIKNTENYTPSIDDFKLIRNTCNIFPIRCAIEIYNGEAFICVPSQGLYSVEFNNFTGVPLQIFKTPLNNTISSENNLIKEDILLSTFNDVDWLITTAKRTCYLSSLLTNYSRVIRLILLSYNYQTSYVNIEINGGDHSKIYANIEGPFSENDIQFYIENNNQFKIRLNNTHNTRIGVIYDSGKHEQNEVRNFYEIKEIDASDFDDTKVANFVPIPNKLWVFNQDSYKYIRTNSLIYDTYINKVVVADSNKKDVFGRRFNYPFINSFTSVVGGNTNIYICDTPSSYTRVESIVFINNSTYRLQIFNNGTSNIIDISNDISDKSLSFFQKENKIYCHANFGENTFFNIMILSNNVSDLDNEVEYNSEVTLPVSYHSGTTQQRPNSNIYIGFQYFDTTLNKPIWWNNTNWVDKDGNPADAHKQGTNTERPTNVDIGFIYKDTTLNKLILWEGTKWVNLDGTELS